MNDSRDKVRALWCRQLSGEQLNEQESQLLSHALRDDSQLRLELSDDATTHALLLSQQDVVQSENDFVQAVMQRVTTADGTTPAEGSELQSSSLPVLVSGQSGREQQNRNARRPQQWLAFLLTLVLFLSVGLIVWFQSPSQTEVAENNPPPAERGVEQTPKVLPQQDNPEPAPDENLAATDKPDPSDGKAPADPNESSPQLATNDNIPAPATPQNASANAELPNMVEETSPTVVAQQFATLTKLENPVWEREDTIGARLGDEVVRLFGGTMELTFDDGAVVTVEGPVEFQPRAVGLIDLRRGRLSATIPRPAIGFTVLTPTSEVVDLGTEFDVSVKDSGASDVVIRKGEVEVAPGGRDGRGIQKWKLVPGRLNHATFYARPDNGKPAPIVAKVQGARGQFHGIISMDGKTANFRSEDTFNNVHERVMTQLKTSQNDIQLQWQDFVDSMQENMRGTMNLNGRQIPFSNLDEVMRLHSQLGNQLNMKVGMPFNGSININGKVIQFKTLEEFESARRAAFGPAANFGAGDLLDMQRGPR
ncbi:MAG: hypothetical protein R3C49_02185 [Planctomycetaceae bacterium]